LVASAATKKKSTVDETASLSALNQLTVTDATGGKQVLYIGTSATPAGSPSTWEMPPVPPVGAFDARFAPGVMVEKLPAAGGATSVPVSLQSSGFPVSLEFSFKESALQSVGVYLKPNGGAPLAVVTRERNRQVVVRSPQTKTVYLKIVSTASDVPRSFALYQNYPNPFNPTTSIRFDVPVSANVTLDVYNILGQKVRALVDAEVYAAGSHTIVFNGANYASGVYFYRLQARPVDGSSASFSSIQKLVLLK
jgi:hypothetical protein